MPALRYRSLSLLAAYVLATALAPPAVAENPGDATLRAWLAKSELVLHGKFLAPPWPVRGESGLVDWYADFLVYDVLLGDDSIQHRTLRVVIRRLEGGPDDRSPLVRSGAKAILFLRKLDPRGKIWHTADVWFGIQPAWPWLAGALRQLAREKPTPEK